MESGTAKAGGRDGAANPGMPPATGNQQVEQDRTPIVFLHKPELARQTAHQPPGHCGSHLRYLYQDRTEGAGGD